MGIAALLLGSNEGDRVTYLDKAKEFIETQVGLITKESSLWETAAWGITDQPNFINQALLVETILEPHLLLEKLLGIEELLGRKRIEKWGPRIIDIDILYYDNIIINENDLKIPHPFLPERRFTLIPLNEISPVWVHPILHKTVGKMLEDCDDEGEVSVYQE
jgi:2-amino-4-hydroxy-6-hydroxymethyldihydropteridine diphosphokinase